MTMHEIIVASRLESIDAEMLVGLVLQKSRSWILAHDDEFLSRANMMRVDALLARRRSGEPMAYITGTKEFYGRIFTVAPDVLIPRPATESLVRLALSFLSGNTPKTQTIDAGISAFVERLKPGEVETVIDSGTGCGCIALTLALEGVKQNIIGVDTSPGALNIAENNRKNLRPGAGLRPANVAFIHADGPSFVRGFRKPFLLVSNPPYIPKGTQLSHTVVDFEPHEALFAGEDGMDVIRPLVCAARENEACVGMMIEMRTDQAPSGRGCAMFISCSNSSARSAPSPPSSARNGAMKGRGKSPIS